MQFYIDKSTARAIKKYPHRATDIIQSFDDKQIKCKQWLVESIKEVNSKFDNAINPKKIIIAGSWYGNVLVPLLKQLFECEIKLHDIDEEVIKIANTIYFAEDDQVKGYVEDITSYYYDSKCLFINTSCEHMSVPSIKPGRMLVLQSNDYREVDEHINCVDSTEQLADQYGLKDIWYAGECEFEKYTRFMVIGKN